MGIRMLHRRAAQRRRAQAHTESVPPPPPPVPAFAATASTARVPADLLAPVRDLTVGLSTALATALRAVATAPLPTDRALPPRGLRAALGRGTFRRRGGNAVGHRVLPAWQLWADLGCGYLALALTLLPRSHPLPALTVSTAVTERPTGAAPRRPHPPSGQPGPDDTP